MVKTTCTGVEMFKKMLDQGQAGDNIGALLRGLKREDVQRGQVGSKRGREREREERMEACFNNAFFAVGGGGGSGAGADWLVFLLASSSRQRELTSRKATAAQRCGVFSGPTLCA